MYSGFFFMDVDEDADELLMMSNRETSFSIRDTAYKEL